MSCPTQPPPPPPSLPQLVEQLATLNPGEAARHREDVADVELRLAAARAQLAADETALAEVVPDGTRRAADAWCLRSSAASGARRALHLLEVDERVLREQLERRLFLARQSLAIGRVVCPRCDGSGDGDSTEAGTCLVPTSCDACSGSGFIGSGASA